MAGSLIGDTILFKKNGINHKMYDAEQDKCFFDGVTADKCSLDIQKAFTPVKWGDKKIETADLFNTMDTGPGIDLDLTPKLHKRVVRQVTVMKPDEAIETTIRSIDKDGHKVIEMFKTKPASSMCEFLHDRVLRDSGVDWDVQQTFDKYKRFRHFLQMLTRELLGTPGTFNPNMNRVVICDPDDVRCIDKGFGLTFRGIPAVARFHKDDIDALDNEKILAYEGSKYDQMLRDSNYIAPNKVQACDLATNSIEGCCGITAGKSVFELAELVNKSDNKPAMITAITNELDYPTTMKLLNILREA